MIPPREVVITGLGLVTPIGIGRDAFWQSLCAQRSGVRHYQNYNPAELPVQFGGEVADFDPKEYVKPRKSLKVMSREIQLGFAAAELGRADAALDSSAVDPDRFGVVMGADVIYFDSTELIDAVKACTVDGNFRYDLWGEKALPQMFPLWLLKFLPNMPACHVAIAQDARGPNNSITHGDVSSLLAISEAMRLIERGRVDVVIAGATGSRASHIVGVFRNDDLLSHRESDPAAASRPFDADRDGLVNAEAGVTLVLESRQHAEARKAKILARLLSYSSTCEPLVPGKPLTGSAIRASIRQALERAKLMAADLGHVSAHGMSTIQHDPIEAQAIRDTLGNVPVTAYKSYFGHTGAACGSIEMAASVLALSAGEVPATLNYERPDPACPVNVIHGRAMPLEKKAALIMSQATMGQAVTIAIAGPN